MQAKIAWLGYRRLEGELYSQVSSICPYLWLDLDREISRNTLAQLRELAEAETSLWCSA